VNLRILKNRTKGCWAALLGLLVFLCATPVRAHEPTIAVLELRDQGKGHYLGSWTLPPVDMTLKPIFPAQCRWVQPQLDCGARGLVGRLSFEGLGSKQSATMIRVIAQNGDVQTYTVSAGNPNVTVATEPGANLAVWLELANTYVNLGIDHILLGIDHLLFVLGLIWLVRSRWMLVKTITSFTVAHSISLAAATFGWVGVPTAPLNAAIALSIVFVGVEIVKLNRGEVGLTARYPWIVAFSFGLLHGLGFATALINLGIPKSTLPIALLFFNVGVEIGQLAFVLVVLALIWAHRRAQATLPRWSASVPAYAIGAVATFWLLTRLPLVVAG
jgi:hypothetical protein